MFNKKTTQRLRTFISLGVGALLLSLSAASNATILGPSMPIDGIIFQGPGDPSQLSGTVNMSYVSNSSTLTIVLSNTSGLFSSTNAASNLLSGVGFVLPSTMSIGGGTASAAGATMINCRGCSSDVSPAWGYDNNPPNSGPFIDPTINSHKVTTVISTVQSSVTNDFSGSAPVKGPSYGILSSKLPTSAAGGQTAFQDFLTFNVTLNGTYSGDLLRYIANNNVVLAFGSPTAAVPEPSSLALFGLGLLGMGFVSRRRKA